MLLLLAELTESNTLITQGVSSAAIMLAALIMRWVMRRAIQSQKKMSPDMKRRWLLQVRNLTLVLIAIGLVLVWATELRTVAISIVAFVVALVLATKELILCLSGGFLKMTSRSFTLGDHIEIGGVRGEVIDQTLLTTKVMESTAGPNGQQFTGRLVTLPNALLLNQPVTNESLTKMFGLHVFTVPVKADQAWQQHEAALLEALRATCAPYLSDAKAAVEAMASEEGLGAPNVDPRVHVSIPEPDRVNLIARLPYPVESKGRILQEVLRAYLLAAASLKPAEQAKPKAAESAEGLSED